MTTPIFVGVDDEEGGVGKTLPPWYVRGWTVQNERTANIPAPLKSSVLATLPLDQVSVVVQQNYLDGDQNPLSGYLTFYPSSAFTVVDGGTSYRILQRFLGTQTFPQADVSSSPWAYSTESSGRIFIWGGTVTARLYATDNPDVTTDDGNPLTYHVIEHFLGGQEFDITLPAATNVTTTSIRDLMITGSAVPYQYDPVNPMGQSSITVSAVPLTVSTSVQFLTYGSTDYVAVDVSALFLGTSTSVDDITSDPVFFAFTQNGADPITGDFHAGTWIDGGPPYEAAILIGPENGGLVLPVGQYTIWFKLVDFPTVPIINVGTLNIT